MAKDKLRVAIAGCGMISDFHIKAMKQIPELEVLGVWDISADAAKALAEKHSVKAYGSYDEMITDPQVDIIDICLPAGVHAQYGCKAAEAGKHLIVEKPIDVTKEAGEQLIAAADKAGVKLAVILQNRFAPSMAKVRKALDEGTLGRLLYGEATVKWYRQESYYTSKPWKGTWEFDGGGALLVQAIHTIDLLLWFMGSRVKNIQSFARTLLHPIEVEDLAAAVLEFESGALGYIVGSTAMKPGFPERIELYGEKGSIALEAGRIVRWQVEGMNEEDYLDPAPRGSGSSDPGGIPLENHTAQLQAIARSILAGEEPPVSGPEAMVSLNCILDIYRLGGMEPKK
ncbi:MAG: Gfo/Idh/MocA family oxidoreductase [Firmicutes bacterium]|nr:Gfo/Idh/MocA family oxidoreductase [Bacillota bacterium]